MNMDIMLTVLFWMDVKRRGKTLEETLSNMRKAIELYWKTLSEEERKEILLREVKALDM